MTDAEAHVDERGRGAAAALKGAVADRPLPTFDPELLPAVAVGDGGDGPSRRPRWVAVAGAAAAALALVGAVLVARDGSRPDDRIEQAESGVTSEVDGHPVAGWLPAGWDLREASLGGAAGLPLDPSADEARQPWMVRTHLLGASVDAPELAVAAVTEAAAWKVDPHRWPSPVRTIGAGTGRPVHVLDGLLASLPAYVVEVADRRIVLAGSSATDEDVLSVATAITVEGDDVTIDPAALPEGWFDLGVVFDALALAEPPPPTLHLVEAESAFATYRPTSADGPTAPSITVVTQPGSTLHASAGRVVAEQAEDVVVRERAGVLVELPSLIAGDDRRTVIVSWEERPGEVVRVWGEGVERDDVLAVAEGLERLDVEGWEDLVAQALTAVGGNEVLVGDGALSDGTRWAMVVTPIPGSPQPAVDVELRIAAQHRTSWAWLVDAAGDPVDDTFGPVLRIGRSATEQWIHGLLDPPDGGPPVSTIEVVDADGASLAEVDVLLYGGSPLWLAEIPQGTTAVTIVATDASGEEIARSTAELS